MAPSLDTRRLFGRRRRLELGMDAQRVALDVPVNHDAPPAVANMPLGGEVLVPRVEVLGIGGAGGRAAAPDRRVTGTQRAVGDDGGCATPCLHADVAPTDVG